MMGRGLGAVFLLVIFCLVPNAFAVYEDEEPGQEGHCSYQGTYHEGGGFGILADGQVRLMRTILNPNRGPSLFGYHLRSGPERIANPRLTIEGNVVTYRPGGNAQTAFERLEMDAEGRAQKRIVSFGGAAPQQIYEYRYRNGICTVDRELRIMPSGRAVVEVDLSICRDLATYFRENRGVTECRCGNHQNQLDIDRILSRRGSRVRVSPQQAGDNIGGDFPLSYQNYQPSYPGTESRLMPAEPAIQAASALLRRCFTSRNAARQLEDARLWAPAGAGSTPAAGPAPAAQRPGR